MTGANVTRAKQVEEQWTRVEAMVQANKVESESKFATLESKMTELGVTQLNMNKIME